MMRVKGSRRSLQAMRDVPPKQSGGPAEHSLDIAELEIAGAAGKAGPLGFKDRT